MTEADGEIALQVFRACLPMRGDKARAVIADKGYDAKANRAVARRKSSIPVIPHCKGITRPGFFATKFYKGRARIE
ncbi:MAG: hypothetical protein RIC87_02970 [Kiloniellales bacterium]